MEGAPPLEQQFSPILTQTISRHTPRPVGAYPLPIINIKSHMTQEKKEKKKRKRPTKKEKRLNNDHDLVRLRTTDCFDCCPEKLPRHHLRYCTINTFEKYILIGQKLRRVHSELSLCQLCLESPPLPPPKTLRASRLVQALSLIHI